MNVIKNGITEVIVKRREENGSTKTIHKGIVVQQTTGGFLRVYNPAPVEKGGDTSQENAEWFPSEGRACWCEVVGQRATKLQISPVLR